MQPVEKHNLRSNKGGLCQTIKKAIRAVVVNKAEVSKEAAREIKAADKVAKKAGSKATAETNRLTQSV